MRLAFVHFLKTQNVGDRQCAPYNFYSFSPHVVDVIDVREFPAHSSTRYDAVIFGGGAIGFSLNRIGRERINSPKVIGWGIGRSHKRFTAGKPPSFVPWADLLGVRDYGLPKTKGLTWVPCVSCKHPIFDELEEVRKTREVVGFINEGLRKTLPAGLPAVMGNRSSMEDIIPFLASAETVVTNSYHGMYWATLLGCKVIVHGAYSSKFHFFHYPPTFTYADQSWKAAAKTATQYGRWPLTEARQINDAFYCRVGEMIGL